MRPIVNVLSAIVGLAAVTCVVLLACAPKRPREHTIALERSWALRAAADVAATGEAISKPGFDVTGWAAATVPSTVLAALVTGGLEPDPFVGRNLEKIDGEKFTRPWWYRTEFTFEKGRWVRGARLVFEGINFSAEVWLNGRKVAGPDTVRGAFRVFDLEVTDAVVDGANALAVLVYPPKPGDLTIGFVDWNPRPPDAIMGIWRPVQLRVSGSVALDDVFVESTLDPSLSRAALTISATLTNRGDEPLTATLAGSIGDITLRHRVELGPHERKRVALSPAELPQLAIEKPRLWWPNGLGEPHLYRLELAALAGGGESDRREATFGIRTVSDYINEQGHRGYKVNGTPLLIKGGGWVDDLLLREDPVRLEAEIAYARHMNLNTLRLEGFWGSSRRLYDLADRYGILLMAGFSCQWEWAPYLGKPVDETYGGVLSEADVALAAAYLRDQIVWLRNHPSVFVWVVGSDMLPKPELERKYREALAELDPTRPLLAACSVRKSEVSGPTGVKMNGPYDYVTPNYWYEDTKNGGAYGFNTETGPGPQPPPLASLERMIPPDHLWPIDAEWSYRCARGQFKTLDRYVNALDRRYGPSSSVEEFARKAQAANYEAMRAMFEAFAVRRPVTTGIIQWMYNAAWPKLWWQLYDYYLMPTGAYFGCRKACQPASVVYDYGDGTVHAVNAGRDAIANAGVELRVFDLGSKQVLALSKKVSLEPDSAQRVAELSGRIGSTPVYFLDARLKSADGAVIASNFYWLSAKRDVLDPANGTWFVTPNKEYADFTSLAKLPAATVVVEQRVEDAGADKRITVKLKNESPVLAFLIELQLVGASSGRPLLPVLWDDNYVSLLPGEERVVTATIAAVAIPAGETPTLRWVGWNARMP